MAETKVVQLTGTSTGGAGRHAQDLTRGLRENGYRALLAGPDDVVTGFDPPARLIPISAGPKASDVQVIRQIRHVTKGAQIIHAHGLRAGALAALANTGRTEPALVVTLHNKPVGSASVRAVGSALEVLVALRAQVILGVSSDLVDRARALGAKAAERALIPAPFDPAATLNTDTATTDAANTDTARSANLRAELGLEPDTPVVLTAARLAPQKGLGLLADTAALLGDRVPGALWLVAGGGPLADRLQEQVDAEGLPVRLLGHRTDVDDLYALADVVVSTSSWEGQPLNVQEALRAGRPIVATDVGGTGEVTGDASLLVPYDDPDAMATAITNVLTDTQLAQNLGASALERAAQLPTRRDALEQVQRVYAGLLE